MKEYDKRKSHKSSKLHVIYVSSNNVRHPVTKTLNIKCGSTVFWLTVWPTTNHKDYNFALYKPYLLYKLCFSVYCNY
jgi:hypothetical protein